MYFEFFPDLLPKRTTRERKMKIGLIFTLLLELVSAGGPYPCRPSPITDIAGIIYIRSHCASFEQQFTSSESGATLAVMQIGSIGPATCSVYKGNNKNGQPLGSFTGDGTSTGILKSSTGSMFLSCPTSVGASFMFITVANDSCNTELNFQDLPANLTFPTSNGKILGGTVCRHVVKSPTNTTFTVTASSGLSGGNTANSIFILSDVPSKPGVRIAADQSNEQTVVVQGRRVEVQIFVWGSGIPAPSIRIDSAHCRLSPYIGNGTLMSTSSTCSSWEQEFTSSAGGAVAIQVASGTLNNTLCSVYEGNNNTGLLLGTFTGDGTSTGIIKSNTSSLYLSCAGGASLAWLAFIGVNNASCRTELNLNNLPFNLALPTSSNGKIPKQTVCSYLVRSPINTTFTITASSGLPMVAANIFILSDDPSKPGVRIGSDQVNETIVEVQGRRLEVQIFVLYPTSPPTITIDSDLSTCRPRPFTGSTEYITIPASCTTCEKAFSTVVGKASLLEMDDNTIGDNMCWVYEGDNKNGTLLGTFTGDGNLTGYVKSTTGSMYLSCVKSTNASIDAAFFFAEVDNPSCDVELDVYDLPINLTLSTGNGTRQSACTYVLTSVMKCNFTITVNYLDNDPVASAIYLLSDDPNQPGMKIKYLKFTRGIHKLQATRVELKTWTYAASPAPTIHIDSVCPWRQQVKCNDTISLSVGYTGLKELDAAKGGVLYISHETLTDLSSVPKSCKAPVENPAFQFGFDKCPSTIEKLPATLRYTYVVRNWMNGTQNINETSYNAYWNASCDFPSSDVRVHVSDILRMACLLVVTFLTCGHNTIGI